MQRRQFIKTASAPGMAFALAKLIHIQGKEKVFRTELVGAGWWGSNILRCDVQSGKCKIIAICDVDDRNCKAAVETVKKLNVDTPQLYRDYRELLAKEK